MSAAMANVTEIAVGDERWRSDRFSSALTPAHDYLYGSLIVATGEWLVLCPNMVVLNIVSFTLTKGFQ